MFDSETVAERGQILTISTRISGIGKEKAAKYGPLCRRCSRIIPSPTGSWGTVKKVDGKLTLINIKYYPPSQISPPDGMKSVDWIRSGFKR